MFLGKDLIALDAKCRVAIPTRHRAGLQDLCSGQVVITEHPDGNLLLMPKPKWEQFSAQLVNMPMANQWLKRIFLGGAVAFEVDGAWRVLLSQELRKAADIEKDLLLVGVGEYFEIWDPSSYAVVEAKAKASARREMEVRAADSSSINTLFI